MTCRHCGSNNLYQSRSGNSLIPAPLRPLLMIGRCHDCQRRMVLPGKWLGGSVQPRESTRKSRDAA